MNTGIGSLRAWKFLEYIKNAILNLDRLKLPSYVDVFDFLDTITAI